jgi:replication factor C subunit 2/4
MKILEGVSTVTQLGAMIARLCRLQLRPELFEI